MAQARTGASVVGIPIVGGSPVSRSAPPSIALAALALIASACAPIAARPEPTPRPTPSLNSVSVADLGIVTLAPVYIAMDRGYFASEGLDVTLVAAKNSSEIASLAATSQVDFGGI